MIPLRCPSFVSGFDRERAVLSEFRVDQILEHLKITYEQLVDICILCGCDYADKINQIGPKRALPLIKKYGNIENIIEKYIKNDAKLIEKHTYHELFLEQVKQARTMFYTAHNINDYLETHNIVSQTANFHWTIPTNIHNEFNELLNSIGMTKDAYIRWGKSLGLL
jgi:5'-3' exonuclease